MGCAAFSEEKYKDGFESLKKRLSSGKNIQRKLDMTMIPNTLSNYEHRPQDYILDLITEESEWSKMDLVALGNFFLDINNLYYDAEDGVPYHNLSHGFDVMIVRKINNIGS